MHYATIKFDPVRTDWTHLHPDQVFTGQHSDEFALTPHLVRAGARVLLLGLAGGAGLRPMLASAKRLDVTTVDLERPTLLACREFYARHFPSLDFRTVHADARRFLEVSQSEFDAIWVDTYARDAYPELMQDAAFYELLERRLAPGGFVAVNTIGLPIHFAPLERDGIQRAVAANVTRVFGHVLALPYRRNLTLIGARDPSKLHATEPHPLLNELDARTLAQFPTRLSALEPITLNAAPVPSDASFSEIDATIADLWEEFVAELRAHGFQLEKPRDLITFVQNETLATIALEVALSRNAPFVTAVPILCADHMNERFLNVDWIFNWYAKNRARLGRHQRSVWRTQLWSMVIAPSGRWRQFAGVVST